MQIVQSKNVENIEKMAIMTPLQYCNGHYGSESRCIMVVNIEKLAILPLTWVRSGMQIKLTRFLCSHVDETCSMKLVLK